jgi:hypothetical protein
LWKGKNQRKFVALELVAKVAMGEVSLFQGSLALGFADLLVGGSFGAAFAVVSPP